MHASSRSRPLDRIRRLHRLAAILLLGFASGLPLALTGQAMQAWLAIDGVSIATIGFFGLVGIPYTFKFLWAPLMDRFEPPWLGRRRGWLVLTQLALAAGLFFMSTLSPHAQPMLFAQIALLIAFLSASQDVVVDAYRADLLRDPTEHGPGASLHVFGYRLAMILSGGIALIWADQWQSWPRVYATMGVLMAGAAAFSLFAIPGLTRDAATIPASALPQSDARGELLGFVAMLAGVVAGYLIARQALILCALTPTTATIGCSLSSCSPRSRWPCRWPGGRHARPASPRSMLHWRATSPSPARRCSSSSSCSTSSATPSPAA